jgi:hypothetical protein
MKSKTENTPNQEEAQLPALFPLGDVVTTPGALESLSMWDILSSLDRHHCGDWGYVCEEDQQENDHSLLTGGRLLSVYVSTDGIRFWIITEADRSVTTVLLAIEY